MGWPWGIKTFCLAIALICFVVAALGIGSGRFNLLGAGLAFVVAGELFG